MLHAFGEANERLETALGIDDVRARLRSVGWLDALDDDDLTAALGQLREWNLVDVIQNHSEDYRSASEYERRNLQYSLTRQGEAALAGVQHAMAVLAAAGALQTAVLDAIGDRLGDLVQRAGGRLRPPDLHHADRAGGPPGGAAGEHQAVQRRAPAAAPGGRRRPGHLPRGQGLDGGLPPGVPDQPRPPRPRHRRPDRPGRGARGRPDAQAGAGRAPTCRSWPAPIPGPAWLEHRRARWDGLRAWFRPADDAPPRVEQLHLVARRAIITLLQVLDRITESRHRTSSAAADFRELARWFTLAPGAGRPAPAVVGGVRPQPGPARSSQPSRPGAGQLVGLVARGTAGGGLAAAALGRADRALQPDRQGP